MRSWASRRFGPGEDARASIGSHMTVRKLKIGLLGCGTVGRGFVELVDRSNALIRQRSGVELRITRILVRDLDKERPGVDRALLTTQPDKVLNNGCDLVVELVGGIEPARSFIERSLARGKHVVTANKALLALDGFSLMKTAKVQKVRLGFEGSVCGGIPIIRALRDGLVGNNIQRLSGILNGTCNYILTRMTEDGFEFEEALREAQAKGFGAQVDADAVQVEGIREIAAEDVQAARELGFVIKHVATAELSEDAVSLGCAPVLLPRSHQLAGIREENNAVLVRGDAVGEMLFSGKGAGSLPSASAVLSDVVDIACHKGGFAMSPGGPVRATTRHCDSSFYIRFTVGDPSAIGPITTILERNRIGVARAAAVWARGDSGKHQVRLLTHSGSRSAVEASLRDIAGSGLEKGRSIVLRVAD